MRTKVEIPDLTPAQQLALKYKLERKFEFDQLLDKMLIDAAECNFGVNVMLLTDILCKITWQEYKVARAEIDKAYKAKD